MTGLEFKIYAVFILTATVPFSVAIGYARSISSCDDSAANNAIESLAVFALGALVAYIVLVVVNWNDKLDVRFILGYALSIAIGASIHTAIIIVGAKLTGLLWPPKTPGMCMNVFAYSFIGTGVLWNDLAKGDNSLLYRMIMSIATR